MSITYAQKNKNAVQTKRENSVSIIDSSSQSKSLQRKANMANAAAQRAEAPRPNNTGMPDNLKTGIESLSGFSMDNVRVHYNSSKPATVQALAYTQGTDIHVAPGQEKHLPHEAWHVAQQMAGRVSPTTNINGMPVNDNAGLEHEADVMGEKAVQLKMVNNSFFYKTEKSNGIIQMSAESAEINKAEKIIARENGQSSIIPPARTINVVFTNEPAGSDNDRVVYATNFGDFFNKILNNPNPNLSYFNIGVDRIRKADIDQLITLNASDEIPPEDIDSIKATFRAPGEYASTNLSKIKSFKELIDVLYAESYIKGFHALHNGRNEFYLKRSRDGAKDMHMLLHSSNFVFVHLSRNTESAISANKGEEENHLTRSKGKDKQTTYKIHITLDEKYLIILDSACSPAIKFGSFATEFISLIEKHYIAKNRHYRFFNYDKGGFQAGELLTDDIENFAKKAIQQIDKLPDSITDCDKTIRKVFVEKMRDKTLEQALFLNRFFNGPVHNYDQGSPDWERFRP